MKLALQKPVSLGDGQTVTELVFREEIVSGDMRGLPVRDPMLYDDFLKIAGRLCAQPDVVMNRLSVADMGEVLKLVSGFMGGGPEAGNAPLQ